MTFCVYVYPKTKIKIVNDMLFQCRKTCLSFNSTYIIQIKQTRFEEMIGRHTWYRIDQDEQIKLMMITFVEVLQSIAWLINTQIIIRGVNDDYYYCSCWWCDN